jgi:hypothetical protein
MREALRYLQNAKEILEKLPIMFDKTMCLGVLNSKPNSGRNRQMIKQ